jgi:hypothetical protein
MGIQAMDIGNREKKETKLTIGDLGKVAYKTHNGNWKQQY